MDSSTAVRWTAYRVVKIGCGEPDEIVGYYRTRSSADMVAATNNFGKKHGCGFCGHGGGSCTVEEISIEP